ncbi:MAG: hypothetical protein ACJAVK_002757 [Akkermansiaceae bacterium]
MVHDKNDEGFLGKFFGADELIGCFAKAGEPSEGELGTNPLLRFGNPAISAIVFLAILKTKSIYDGFFITDQPVEERKRGRMEFFLTRACLDKFGLP